MDDNQSRPPMVGIRRELAEHASLRMSTENVPERARFEYWEDICRKLIGGFQFADYSLKNFRAEFNMLEIGSLKIGHYVGSPHAMDRNKSYIRSSDSDDYIIILESQRIFNLDHGRYHKSSAGGISLLNNAEPFLGSHPEGLDIINVFVPRAMLEQAIGPARHIVGMSIDAAQPSYPIIMSYLRALIANNALLDPARKVRMASVAVELIATGFAEKMEVDAPQSLSSASILSRAQTFIANHIGVEGLSMNDVAAGLQMSVRRLQEIASAENISLMDWMWERRLRLAREKLSGPASLTMPIGLIAYQCGFISQAHFSRRFKERFGQTPTEFRVAAGVQRAAQAPLAAQSYAG